MQNLAENFAILATCVAKTCFDSDPYMFETYGPCLLPQEEGAYLLLEAEDLWNWEEEE